MGRFMATTPQYTPDGTPSGKSMTHEREDKQIPDGYFIHASSWHNADGRLDRYYTAGGPQGTFAATDGSNQTYDSFQDAVEACKAAAWLETQMQRMVTPSEDGGKR